MREMSDGVAGTRQRKEPLRCPACALRVGDHDGRCEGCGADVRLWIRRGEQVWGPYDLARVREGHSLGRIVETDEVAVGQGPWQPIGQVDLSAPAVPQAPAQRLSSRITLRWAGLIVLVGVAIGLAAGAWGWYKLSSSRADMACRQNLRAIMAAVEAYRAEHGRYPFPDAQLPKHLASYLPAQEQWWTCPKTAKPYRVGSDGHGDLLVWDAPASGKGPHKGLYHVGGPEGILSQGEVPKDGVEVKGLSADKTNPAAVQGTVGLQASKTAEGGKKEQSTTPGPDKK